MSNINKYFTDIKFRDYFRKYKQVYENVTRATKAYEINKELKSSDNISKTF